MTLLSPLQGTQSRPESQRSPRTAERNAPAALSSTGGATCTVPSALHNDPNLPATLTRHYALLLAEHGGRWFTRAEAAAALGLKLRGTVEALAALGAAGGAEQEDDPGPGWPRRWRMLPRPIHAGAAGARVDGARDGAAGMAGAALEDRHHRGAPAGRAVAVDSGPLRSVTAEHHGGAGLAAGAGVDRDLRGGARRPPAGQSLPAADPGAGGGGALFCALASALFCAPPLRGFRKVRRSG